MSNIHAFSQTGFWDFVANLKARNNVENQKATPGNRAMEHPRGAGKGFGRRARIAAESNHPASPLAELDPMPTDVGDEKSLPPQYQPLPEQVETVTVDSEKEKLGPGAIGPNGGKNRGPGPRGRFHQAQGLGGEGPRGRRMRMALFEDGSFPSEEELAAMAEVRRLRRLRRQAYVNANANGDTPVNAEVPGPCARRMRRRFMEQAMTAENDNNEIENKPKRRMGPRALRRQNRTEAGEPTQMNMSSEKAVGVSSDEEKATTGPHGLGPRRGGAGVRGRGVCGFKQARKQEDMPIGGPTKFAPMFQKGANPSNGEGEQYGPPRFGPRARKMAALRKQAQSDGQDFPQYCNGENNGNTQEFPMRRGMGRPAMRRAMRQQNLNQAQMVNGEETGNPIMALPLRERKLREGKPEKEMKKAFKPRPDTYDTPGAYIVHLPVPGATQKDVGFMWDSEKSVLRIAGMIQRPSPEQIADGATLVRARRAVGPFRRWVKFGKKNQKVKVYEDGITAKLEDGILKVEIPKYDGDDVTSDGEYIEVKPTY